MGGGASTGKGKSKNVNAFQVKYHEGEELGTGAFSVVKRCTRFHDNWTGAVKVIRKEDIPTPEEELSLKTEISILGSLDHENQKTYCWSKRMMTVISKLPISV